jgi:DNA invertase Pin-like site-specific DNA recombinase
MRDRIHHHAGHGITPTCGFASDENDECGLTIRELLDDIAVELASRVRAADGGRRTSRVRRQDARGRRELMTAAVYARYSSENQRPESIDDQVSACRRLARERSLTINDDHIYADQAQSGARSDRPGLAALLAAAPSRAFDVVLIDDLSRLARDNHLMLSIIAELHFEGIRVISVADGLDSTDEESTLAIQVRGIFNELQLHDLKKKTLRGHMGQKERGFSRREDLRISLRPVRPDADGQEGQTAAGGLRDGDRAEGSGGRAADLHFRRRGHAANPDRKDAAQGKRPRQHPGLHGLVPGHDQPHSRQREVLRPLDLEPN